MRYLTILLFLVSAACVTGDNCDPLPECASLGWDGSGNLPCTKPAPDDPARCSYDGQVCMVGASDQIVCR